MTGPARPPRLDPPSPAVVTARAGHTSRWPRRRRVAAAMLFVALVLLGTVGQGWAFATQPLWSVVTLGALVVAAGALATFVPLPGEGLHVHLGCGPCAAAGGLAALGGAWLALTSAFDAGTASLALALGGFALARRLTEPQTCDRPF